MGIFQKKKETVEPEVVQTPSVSHGAVVKTSASPSIVLKPVVTEKSAILASKNMYVFAVKEDANKLEVAQAIKQMYEVNPRSVNILNVRGKIVRRGRISGKRKGWKKAIVTLPKGKTLNLYEGV